MIASRRARSVALVVVVAAFVALAAFALLARAYEPGRAGVPIPNSSLSLVTPRLAAPIATSTEVAGVAIDAPAASPGASTPAPSPSAGPSPSTPPPGAPAALAPCELGLAVPTEQAGLANLVSIIPLFGPFSPEAFAMVPAFEPAFPLFGPMLIAGGSQLDSLPVDQVVSVMRPLENQGYDAISSLYAPARPQVLAGEAQLAAALRPGVAAFAALPGATCLPASLALLF